MASAILTPGANAPLPGTTLTVTVRLEPASIEGADVDISAFLLDAAGKVRGDEGMVFYGQPAPGNGAVSFTGAAEGGATFALNLDRLEDGIEKVAFSATIHENRRSFSGFKAVNLALQAPGVAAVEGRIDTAGMQETALILGEIYRRQGAWKFRLVGQGFAGGLKPLAEHFGVSIADAPTPPAPAPAVPPPATPAPPPRKVSLSKVTLDKTRPSISLEKKASGFGEIKINLNWHREPKSKGVFSGLFGKSGIDLDLGCLIEMADGSKGVVQALGNSFGSFNRAPYIELLGDDRTGAISEGEWLKINGTHWGQIRRVLIYAFIYEGAPNWATTDGVVTLYAPGEPPIEVRLTEGSDRNGMCAIALLESVNGALKISHEVRYFPSHLEMDKAYQWGMRWAAGSK